MKTFQGSHAAPPGRFAVIASRFNQSVVDRLVDGVPIHLVNTDPLLGPLTDNGGVTYTRALLPGSPAIDLGVAVPGVTTDQRGDARSQSAAPDIGAFDEDIEEQIKEEEIERDKERRKMERASGVVGALY